MARHNTWIRGIAAFLIFCLLANLTAPSMGAMEFPMQPNAFQKASEYRRPIFVEQALTAQALWTEHSTAVPPRHQMTESLLPIENIQTPNWPEVYMKWRRFHLGWVIARFVVPWKEERQAWQEVQQIFAHAKMLLETSGETALQDALAA